MFPPCINFKFKNTPTYNINKRTYIHIIRSNDFRKTNKIRFSTKLCQRLKFKITTDGIVQGVPREFSIHTVYTFI